MTGVTRRELAIALVWSVFVMLVTAGPYLEGARLAGDRYFSGLVSAVDDGNVYLQWIRQAAEGSTTLRNQYSTDPQRPVSVNVFLLVLGRAAAVLGETPAQVFQAARILAGILCLVSFFLLVSALTPDPAVRWTSLLLVSLSSGLGWAFELLSPGALPPIHPIDYGPRWVYQPEAITFLSLLLNPLFAFSLALMCLTLLCAWRGLEGGRVGWAVAAGVLLLVLGNVHTYDLPVVHLTLLAWVALGAATKRFPWWRGALFYLLILLLSLPSPLWQFHVLRSDPLYRAKADTPTPSQPYLDYVFGYGLVWLLAAIGAVWVALRKGPERAQLLPVVLWAVIASAVIYLPIPAQRKLAEGLHFPLCLLAAVAVAHVLGGWLARHAPGGRGAEGRLCFAAAVVVLLTIPSNVLFYGDCFRAVRTNNAEFAPVFMPPIYLERGGYEAMQELARRGTDQDVVLASSMMGNYIPSLTRCSVVAGHWAETVNLQPLADGSYRSLRFQDFALPAVLAVYGAATPPATKAAVLLRFRVTFVFCGATEGLLYAGSVGAQPAPGEAPQAYAARELAKLPFLHQVYERDGVALFSVAPPDVLQESLGSRPGAETPGAGP